MVVYPESLPRQVLWCLEASPGSLILDQGHLAPQRLGEEPKATPIPSSLPSLSLHLAPRDSSPGPWKPSGCSQRWCWQKEVDKTNAVTCVTGPEGHMSHQSQGVFRPGPKGHEGGLERTGLWGRFVWGVGRALGAWAPPVTAGSQWPDLWSLGCHPMSPPTPRIEL